jgi:Ser/Thr protein kinase RdoA (MazF antagonist)
MTINEIAGIEILAGLGGHQNTVYRVLDGQRTRVLRVTDARHRSLEDLKAVHLLMGDLADLTDLVHGPVPFPSGESVIPLTHDGRPHHATLSPYFSGDPIAVDTQNGAQVFGRILAELHRAMHDLTSVYELSALPPAGGGQVLIHGDFNPSNVLVSGQRTAIIDFENACYASVPYELGNTIYMVLFDFRHDIETFITSGLKDGFIRGYRSIEYVNPEAIRACFDRRVFLLKGWLEDYESAPLVISSADDVWKRELTDFVLGHEKGNFDAIWSD